MMIKWLICFAIGIMSLASFGNEKIQTDAQVTSRVDFSPTLNATLPDLMFSEGDKSIHLKKVLNHSISILAFAWFDCENLCGLLLNGIADSTGKLLQQSDIELQVIVVSMDPAEDYKKIAHKRESLNQQYPLADIQHRWHFLVGSKQNTSQLADAIGYKYYFDARKNQYAHPAGIVVLDKNSAILSFQNGINYRAQDIQNLMEATPKKQPDTSKPNSLLLLCYDFDPSSGRYNLAIIKLLRWVAALFVISLVVLIVYWQKKTAGGGRG